MITNTSPIEKAGEEMPLVLTIEKVRQWLRSDPADDEVVESLIYEAVDTFETRTGGCLIWNRQFEWAMAQLPTLVAIDLYPITELVSVSYRNYDGDLIELEVDTDVKLVRRNKHQAYLNFKVEADTEPDNDEAVLITLRAGFIALPPAIENIIKQLIHHLYENRGDETKRKEYPSYIDYQCNNYRPAFF